MPTMTTAQQHAPSEAEIRESPDAAAGLRLVRARLDLCTPDERQAFWEAVRRCFGGPAPEEAGA
ncbi:MULTISPECIES: hypothetical protein [Methylobacterium]|jgi:hypothetical protein|uniref:Uncharacterized protein n=1 Tax=Methylobacterium hispanicum TaxID=270350 RepID=A0AAV4ZMI1_9HYPH|nr:MULTISPECIES: hypothetical protein [Methylobacterium]GJD89662.1 hypothetical protein BHAOGJBA_3192 [Methylobacterium hispanicum]